MQMVQNIELNHLIVYDFAGAKSKKFGIYQPVTGKYGLEAAVL
jgi:hypothetical protein